MEYRDSEICERIKEIMHEESLKQKDLAERTGVVQSSISAILNGVRSPEPLVNAMCEKMGINKEWLVNGAGFKYRNSVNLASDIENISKCEPLSAADKISLIKEVNALYEKHQSLLDEAQNIMKIIVEMNKKILLGGF